MANRLADELSPYLRQHAENPVDWYPWGPDAFAEARRSDRPILLSIGYSACHWCHVMAHESFEDPATAAVVNERFVCVKVDREERPDVDAVYMEAVQAMTGSGGWPLTAFLTPDGRPFFTGTYFPSRPAHGRPTFLQVCDGVHQAWTERRHDLEEQADAVAEHLRASALPGADGEPETDALRRALDAARTDLLEHHDPAFGGFGRAPKFPQTMGLDLLLRLAHRAGGDPEMLAVVTRSLDAMAAGGIHDHLGGGFARYSVDSRWLVPHFEKMLYDQALLARVYLHGWLVTGDERYRRVLEGIVGYVERDLRRPGGAFAAAEDADSEGVEGRFYVWTPDSLRAALAGSDLDPDAVAAWWDVTPHGNFEGASILNRIDADPREPEPDWLPEARRLLFAAREERVRPGLDDKVLTEWNGLLIASLAEAGAATGTERWVRLAEEAADFLLANLRDADGRWLRSWQQTEADGSGRAAHPGLAADHAALVDAFTRLAEATGRARWIAEASAVADALLDQFWDTADGGLFTTPADADDLIVRPKDLLDNATPSANSLAAVALLRLAALTGADRYRDHGARILALLGDAPARHPSAFGHLLAGACLLLDGVTEIAVVGDAPDLVAAVHGRYLPGAVLAWGEPHDSPLWSDREPGRAYVCEDFTCQAPVSDPADLTAQLDRSGA